eukprot:jgi/Tetstr1/433890/TSEL_023070.t1
MACVSCQISGRPDASPVITAGNEATGNQFVCQGQRFLGVGADELNHVIIASKPDHGRRQGMVQGVIMRKIQAKDKGVIISVSGLVLKGGGAAVIIYVMERKGAMSTNGFL